MKKTVITALAAATLVTACQTDSPMNMAGTRFEELPSNVQQAARSQIGDAQIVDIDQERRTGTMVYEITYAGADNNREKLHISEDGSLIGSAEAGLMPDAVYEAAGAEPQADVSVQAEADASRPNAEFEAQAGDAELKVDANGGAAEFQADANIDEPTLGTRMEDLPAAVQSTIRQHARNAEIDDIDKEERTGQVIYEVTFKDEGLNPKIHVAQDGRLVSEKEAELFHNEAAGAERSDRIEAKREVRGGAESLTEGPAANADVDVNTETDISNDSAGAEFEAEADLEQKDAAIEADANISGEAAGAEPRSGAAIGAPAQAAQVRFNALPQAVQNAIRTRGGEAQVSDINRKTVYEVKFNNKAEKLTISEDGMVIEQK